MRRKSPRLDCDVGLGLKMPAHSYYCDGDGGGHNLYGGVADGLFAQRSFNSTVSTGGMGGKGVFTASQWEELERQKMIHKYILASIPVPPQLLSTSCLSQCNRGLDLRFSSGGGGGGSSDAEPWRCKRTDGKKWRCSRDVAPDLKYCERHAHKSRPRSRKLVELSSHKPTPPNLSPAPSSTRCIEWFMKGGSDTNSISISTHKQHHQQWEHVMHPSSSSTTMELNREADDFMTLNPYIPDTTNLHSPILDPKTRHFIDAWEKEGKTTKFPISPSSSAASLSLSMCGGDYDLGIGISERENEGVLRMMNSVSWTNSPPGGPLGEALCLGNATTTRGSYGYSNTNTNSRSKSSCEDGTYALNFIGGDS